MTFNELLTLVHSRDKTVESRMRICLDSRLVREGDIFIAIEGSQHDGHNFIDEAIDRGAKYIVCQKRELCFIDGDSSHRSRATGHEIIIVDDSTQAAAILAQTAAGNPALQLTNLAVTGTNGKTTVAYLVRSVIQTAGEKCGLISTIVYDTGLDSCQASLTTPDCLDIAIKQQQMLKAGCKFMVVEASSHALSQNRLAGINFKAAGFTNLASDHLDFHKTKENYLAAKTRLFQQLPLSATAVLNKQSPEASQIAQKTKAKILWYAIDEPADITAHIKSMDINGTVFVLEYRGQSSIVRTPLLGRFNVTNHLAAAGLCLSVGFDLETITTGLSALRTIPGRLEKLDYPGHGSRGPSHVFIDYAHTDDALRNVLSALKPLCKGKLIVVFGCGGDRDRSKRPRMAKVAEQLADFIIVTSDNPRTERPEDIIEEIVAGFENRATSNEQRATKIIEVDRKKAIELAIKTAGKNDIVLIAGKGHETYQIIGNQKFDFNDKDIALNCLNKQK